MNECPPVPGALKAENALSTCHHLEYLGLKMTQYLPVPTGVLGAENDGVPASTGILEAENE